MDVAMDLLTQGSRFNPIWRKRCVLGCGTETPQCPKCPDDTVCSLIPMTCDSCQMTVCVPRAGDSGSDDAGPKKSGSSTNIGAIAGGAIAGIIVIAGLVYCVWRFCIKPKRQHFEQDVWLDNHSALSTEKERSFRPDARLSTHTVGSVASSTMTRASNVIQIAYIPGVTNRGSTPSSPGLLVPPVPPLPMALSSPLSSPGFEQEHFFMPGDLRDSTCSAQTSDARYSVASTIYGKNAIVSPVPAQTALRGKAAVVSVVNKNGNNNDPAPAVPEVDYGKYGIGNPPSPAFSVGSTFLSNANSTTVTKPVVVKVSTPADKKVDDSDRESTATTLAATPSPPREQGPFADPTSNALPSATVSPMSSREPMNMSIPNLPGLDTPRGKHEFTIPNLPELDTPPRSPPRRKSRQSARIPDLPELDTPMSQPPKSSTTPFGDEHEINSAKKSRLSRSAPMGL